MRGRVVCSPCLTLGTALLGVYTVLRSFVCLAGVGRGKWQILQILNAFYDFRLFCLGKGGDIVSQSTGMYGFGLVITMFNYVGVTL